MNKISCASQNTEAKTLPADICIFGHFGRFHLVLFTQLTSNLTLEWNGRSMFHPFSYIYTKTFFFVELKQFQTLWIVDALLFLFISEQMQHPLWTQLSHRQMVNTLPSEIFISFATSCNFNLWLTKTSLWSFLVFSGKTDEFGQPECLASFVSVRPRSKSAYHPLTIVPNRAESE